MSIEEMGSVTRWVEAYVANGDQEAARHLWGRYFQNLVGLARAKLGRKRRPGLEQDAEDVALSALKNFFVAAKGDRFPLLKDRDDLWWLLIKITARKAHDLDDREGRKKRGGGQVPGGDSTLGNLPAPEPTPQDLAIMTEQFQRLLDLLGDETLRQIALWRLEGHSNDEIAEQLGCSRRTVANRFTLIRERWEAEVPPEGSP